MGRRKKDPPRAQAEAYATGTQEHSQEWLCHGMAVARNGCGTVADLKFGHYMTSEEHKRRGIPHSADYVRNDGCVD